MRHLRRAALVLPVALLFVAAVAADASFFRALVAEVPDGTTLVVASSGRRLTVALKGVQPPRDAREAEQAQRHLSKLALGREVLVEYTGLRGRSIYARVHCGEMDLGLQLVRDGAARYDAAPDNTLTAAERQLYADSERAAERERRGVWQPAASSSAAAGASRLALTDDVSVAPQSARRQRASGGLNTEDAIINRMASPASAGKGATKQGGPAKQGGAVMVKQTGWPLNTPGEEFDVAPFLGQGRTTVVYFYAEWCPACRARTPMMKNINRAYSDLEVLALDIKDWGTPIVVANRIEYIPYLRVYDKSGALVAEGKEARDWLMDWVVVRSAGAKGN